MFVHDRQTHTTERVSVGPGGLQGNNSSYFPSISADGRFVAFLSIANTLLGPGVDANGHVDIFVHDRQTHTTELVSVGRGGIQGDGDSAISASGGGISADGRYVLFMSDATNLLGPGSDTNGLSDNFVRDRLTGVTDRVTVGPGIAPSDGTADEEAQISADGRLVGFASTSTDLLGPGGDTNGFQDAFIRGADSADPNGIDATLFPDGELDDTVLEAVDATTGAITTLCPAGAVSVSNGNAAFLRPESAVGTRFDLDAPRVRWIAQLAGCGHQRRRRPA